MAVEATITAPTERRRELWRQIVKSRWAYIFISPFFILFLIFQFGPILFSIYLSVVNWKGLGAMEFVGLKNFTYLFGAGGAAFRKSVLNGFILFFMYVPIMTFLAIVLAVILNSKKIRGIKTYRTLIFAPYVTSMIAAGFTFRLLLEQKGGLFNIALEALGLPGIPWLESLWGARVSLCLLVVWGWLGYNMVIMLAGLQTIPRELAEAALIDGASPVQAFFRITIPLLRPVILFSVILSTMGSFGLFNELMALFYATRGSGPMRATLTPVVHIYQVAFDNFRYGRASATAYVYFALIFVLAFLQNRYFGRED
ncbi:MAG: sugar ABC transporter permease [Anaerolineae bacterium]|nr:sugar ABC transporter permease [Anaerolineae bacterium]